MTVGAVSIRPARLDDAEALAIVHVRAWQAAYRGLMPSEFLARLDVAERVEAWRARLSEPAKDRRTLVGTLDGQVAGFTAFGAARDEEPDDGELYAINVHPEHWGSGVGSALLRATHTGLTELGHRRAVLWVVTDNDRARRFYEGHGWEVKNIERTADVQGLSVREVRYTRALA